MTEGGRAGRLRRGRGDPILCALPMALLLRCLIRLYQWTFSPLLAWLGGPGSGCRFYPTCSDYFLQALEKHGAWRGSWLGLKRLARCHPWGGKGQDPVPEPEDRHNHAHSPGFACK